MKLLIFLAVVACAIGNLQVKMRNFNRFQSLNFVVVCMDYL